MKQPCWKCGGTGIVRNEEGTVYETVCPICGGTMYLDDMVYKGPTIDDIIATQLERISVSAKNIDNHNSMDELTALELIARLKEYGIAYTPKEDIDALVEHLEKTFVKPKSCPITGCDEDAGFNLVTD